MSKREAEPESRERDDGGNRDAAFAHALLSFYDAHRRALPWRRDADPYRVWVSEIMLQQTQVETVIPYYERWLERFPSLDALADAELDEVLRRWEGLGYYSRARNLHRAARLVRERHHGRLPSDYAALRALPGVGDYTAGAVASIAFGHAVPAVDGNVRRVFARLFDLPAPSPAHLRRLAARLVPAERPGDFNQALMELGATVCTPRTPACKTCPVASFCLAHERGVVAERPQPKPKKAIPEDDVATTVIFRDGHLLLRRRPEDGLLGGLWEFPGTPVAAGEDPADAALCLARALAGAEIEPGAPLGAVVHTFTHRRTTYYAYRFGLAGDVVLPAAGAGAAAGSASVEGADPSDALASAAWVTPARLAEYALPVAQRKIAARAFKE